MKSNVEWEKWGKVDPLFAVASWPGKQRNSPDAWTDADFYALGESDWSDYFHHWKHFGVSRKHCVEIGCGAGRITKQLAGAFEQVTALDISEDQIKYAQANITNQNVKFHVTDGLTLPLPDHTVSAVFSCQVFQHFDRREDALTVLKEVSRILIPDGTFMIQLPLVLLPTHRGSGFIRGLLRLIDHLKAWKDSRMRGSGKLIMRMVWYETVWLISALKGLGFNTLEIRHFAVRSNNKYHDFVLAGKDRF